MEQTEDYIIELISKKLGGTASEEELLQLQRWIDANPLLNQEEYNAIKKIWEESSELPDNLVFNTKSAWAKLDNNIKEKTKTQKPSQVRRISTKWMAAASILLLIIAVTWLLVSRYNSASDTLTVISDVDNKIVQLSDSSKVTLRKGAVLKYPSVFASSIRALELSGDAFFVVKKNSKAPFIISTNNAKIRVLGTSFFVHARSDSAGVIVSSGRVRFTDKSSDSDYVELTANEAATLAMHKFEKKIVQNTNYLSWQTGVLDFNNEPLSQVVEDLNDYYPDTILLSPELSDVADSILIKAHFDKEPIDQVLKDLAGMANLHSKTENNKIILFK